MEKTVYRILKHWLSIPRAVSTGSTENGRRLLQYSGCCFTKNGAGALLYNETAVDSDLCSELFEDVWAASLQADLTYHLNCLETAHKQRIHDMEFGGHPPILSGQDIHNAMENLDTIIPDDGTPATRRLNRLYRALKKAGYKPTTELKPKKEEEDNND